MQSGCISPLKIEEQWGNYPGTRVIDQFNRFPGSMGTRKVTLVANGSQYRDANSTRICIEIFRDRIFRFSFSLSLSLFVSNASIENFHREFENVEEGTS